MIVHCKTKEEARKLINITLNNMNNFSDDVERIVNFWDIYKDKTCYNLHDFKHGYSFYYKKFYLNNDDKIISFRDFIKTIIIKGNIDQNYNKNIIKYFESLGFKNIGLNGINYKGDIYYYINSDDEIYCSSNLPSDRILVNPIDLNNNKTIMKEFRIEIPEGYEIDRENSTFECVKFKLKRITYVDVAESLLANGGYYIDDSGNIESVSDFGTSWDDPNNLTSVDQGNKLLAINRLMNVAKYLNKDWKMDCVNNKYYIYKNSRSELCIGSRITTTSDVYFKSEEDARQAIEILGEDIIRLALSTDW